MNEGNHFVDTVAKAAAVSNADKLPLLRYEEPGVFGVWLPEIPESHAGASEQAGSLAAPDMPWARINVWTLRRQMYNKALAISVQQEAERSHKDARGLVTTHVMNTRAWVSVQSQQFDDQNMAWWYQVRA